MTAWPMVRLGAVARLDRTSARDVELPYIGLEDIAPGSGKIVGALTPRKVKSNTFIFDDSHVLYGRLRPYLNKWAVPDYSGHCATEILPIKPNELLLRKYLAYWLSSDAINRRIDQSSRGARMPRANMEEVFRFEIPLPPLDEQERIVAKLDEASSALIKLTENVEKAEKLEKALWARVLTQAMGHLGPNKWARVLLGDLFETSSGATPLKSRKDFYQNGEIPWLLSGEVSQRSINAAKNFITEKALVETAAKIFPVNSVLVAMYGATAGQVGLLEFESATNQAVCAIYPSPNYLPRFVYYVLLSAKNLLRSQAVGNAQPNISQEKIKNLLFPLVPLDEQRRIVAKLDQINDTLSELRRMRAARTDALEAFQTSFSSSSFSQAA